jgi:NhaP-type Na+/H+ or K+/H+ antiporter
LNKISLIQAAYFCPPAPLVCCCIFTFACTDFIQTQFWCLLSRAVQVFPISFLLNLCRPAATKIPLPMQVCIWFAGLRGAIAFALSLQVPTPGAPYIVSSTLVVVIFTSLVCGALTEPLLRKMGMRAVDLNAVAAAAAANAV